MSTPNANVHVLEQYRARQEPFFAVNPPATSYFEAREALRLAAVAADASATTEIGLALLWRQLARGTSRVVDGFLSQDRCYLVLSLKTEGAEATPIEARRMDILEAVLNAARQKNVAIDLDLAPSTVAMSARLALKSLGVNSKPSRAHPLLMLAVWAVNESAATFARYSTLVARDDRESLLGWLRSQCYQGFEIDMPRPDRCLGAELPSAELAVIRCLVEGLSHGEIARLRGTSTRTIANQIGAVFRRLHVSGRNELVQRLFREQSLLRRASQPLKETLIPSRATESPNSSALHAARRSA